MKLGNLRTCLANTLYMIRTRAPMSLIGAYLSTQLNHKRYDRHVANMNQFRSFASEHGTFSNDWFTHNIPYWLEVFDQVGLVDRHARILEIGSWEGMSTLFMLRTLPQSDIVCVDNWCGADAYRQPHEFVEIEEKFNTHIGAYKDRVRKEKMTSFTFFNRHTNDQRFDLIYVDGSHHVEDVVVDAFKSFSTLSIGGILIFDDYLGRYFKRVGDNPAAAINFFLRTQASCYRFLSVGWQVIIQKTAEPPNH